MKKLMRIVSFNLLFFTAIWPMDPPEIVKIEDDGKQRGGQEERREDRLAQVEKNEITQMEESLDDLDIKKEDLYYKNYSFHIRSFKFDPTYKKYILLIAVHGTYGDGEQFGKNINKTITKYIIQLGNNLSLKKQCAVRFITFNWPGALRLGCRQEAAKVLALRIKQKLKALPVLKIWTVAHSHGCNVVNMAADLLKKNDCTFDVAIHIACPASDIKQPSTKTFDKIIQATDNDRCFNIRKIFHWYSTGDATQIIGSCQSSYSFERRLPFLLSTERKVYNIRIQEDGGELHHLNIMVPVLKNLDQLLPIIEGRYPDFFDLEANVLKSCELPIVATRKNIIFINEETSTKSIGKSIIYSLFQKERFRKKYNREIGYKGRYIVASAASEAWGKMWS